MRHILSLLFQLTRSLAKLLRSGGAKALVAENLLLKHQLMIARRSRRRALGRYLRIVAVEACSPSLANSSRIRGLPHVGLTAHMRRMSRINFRSFPGRPRRRREFHRQNILNPAR
jgi:hypothetical protein